MIEMSWNLRCVNKSYIVLHVGHIPKVAMKLMTTLALAAPFFLAGCNAAMWGNLAVLGVTVAIFVGTLGLGRTTEGARSQSDASTTAGH